MGYFLTVAAEHCGSSARAAALAIADLVRRIAFVPPKLVEETASPHQTTLPSLLRP